MLTRRLPSWILVGVAIAIVLGHVCATPMHAHAVAAATHSDDHSEHHHGHAVHGGSCEALRATSPAVPVLQAEVTALPVIDDTGTARALVARPPRPASSPPLYLLHAVLLI
jgi:hypothetical protein